MMIEADAEELNNLVNFLFYIRATTSLPAHVRNIAMEHALHLQNAVNKNYDKEWEKWLKSSESKI